eukprot:TRINITY_DN5060_c0_g1_i1.p2 TRINITY_DN5060_c0_g1~~TRINITY_DN5060_c0_g1_i1.p2  ORF type:complete len:129 (+),score=14.79 TRINITY_DN5060_c0_g1_i1:65-451(+)
MLKFAIVLALVGVAVGDVNTFEQTQCDDRDCLKGCKTQVFKLDTCLPTVGGGSTVVLSCNPTGMNVLEYLIAEDCSGFAVSGQQPVGVCVRQGNTFFQNECMSGHNSSRGIPLPPSTPVFMTKPVKRS